MALSDLMREVKTLSRDDLEALYLFVQSRREQQQLRDAGLAEGERDNDVLDVDELKGIFAELRAGFTEQDLEELDWAMNFEYVKPLDEDDEIHP